MLQAIKNLWRYLKRYKGLFVLSFVTIIVGQALLLVAPLLVKELLDEHITGISYSFVEVKQPKGDFKKVKISLGGSDGINVEILSGLTKDSEVKVWNPSDKDKEALKEKGNKS